MASTRGDVVGFRRIFVLFLTLVLLPAMLLSGFGVVAIVNESGAEDARRQRAADALLRDAQAELLRLLDASGADAPAARIDDSGALLEGDVDDPTELVVAARGLKAGDRAFVARPGGLIALTRGPGGVSVTLIDDGEVRATLARAVGPRVEMSLELRVASDRPEVVEVGVINRLMRELGRDDGVEDLIRARAKMDPPFDRYHLVVTSQAPGVSTARIVYIVLLALFYVLLIVGVVLTSRLIWQETRLSRLKTDFVSHVSHELRTPLTSIRMFIETLRLGRARSIEEQEECLELLSKETERLSEMIERVLGYARIRAGRRQFANEAVPPSEIVDDALRAFRAQNLDAEDLDLVREVADELPPVGCDREATVEALLNLIGNAWKYAGEAGYIRVFARPGRRGRCVAVGVEDRGPGLHKSEHKRVFERFYQSGQLLSRSAQGSGLGLAITKGIVEGQGGRIRVESAPGEGATFIIELPVDETAA